MGEFLREGIYIIYIYGQHRGVQHAAPGWGVCGDEAWGASNPWGGFWRVMGETLYSSDCQTRTFCYSKATYFAEIPCLAITAASASHKS